MLQLPDASGGPSAPLRPARQGVLSVWVACPDQPRSSVLADLVCRVAGRHHLRAIVSQPVRTGWDALNVHPAQVCAGPPEPLDVAVAPAGSLAGSPAHLIRPGAVRAADATGLDPLAVRLALLRHRFREDLTLTRDDLDADDEVLRDWRAMVSDWATSPSRPMCAQYTGDFLDALDDGLDTPAALRTLSALAGDQQIPDGAKFESFAYFDRFLGLDLAREVGR
jgi:hypothetical protein